VLPRARADVDDPVGVLDGVLVVLDDDQRVAEVAQPLERLDQPAVVALVQPDRRLVEDVEHADQPRADLRRQPDPLRLAAGERARRAVEREVVEADVEQEAQPRVDLLEHPLGDHGLPLVELHAAQERRAVGDRQRRDVGDRPAAHRHRERLRLEPGPLAARAGHLAHVALVALPAGVALRLGVPPLEVGDHALEAGPVGPLTAVAVAVADVHLGVSAAVQDRLLRLGRQLVPGRVHPKAVGLGHRLQQPAEVLDVVAARPGRDGALLERPVLVGDDQLGVDLAPGAEPGALLAGAVRAS
jgi:hypothetical protein